MNTSSEEYNVQILNVREYARPAHSDIVIVYVLKGEVSVQTDSHQFQLNAGDIYFLNRRSSWGMIGTRNNIVLFVTMSPFWLSRQTDTLTEWHFGIEAGTNQGQLDFVKQHILLITMAWLKKNQETWRLEINRSLSEIVRCLLLHFKAPPPPKSSPRCSARIDRALNWINDNFRDKITLQQFAFSHHISEAHLSRLFSSEIGMSFRDYLTGIRLKGAVRDMNATDHPLSQIIDDNGFSTPRIFGQQFKREYGVLPHVFRKGLKEGIYSLPPELTEINKELLEAGEIRSTELYTLLARESANLEPVTIGIDAPKSRSIKLETTAQIQHKAKREYEYVIIAGSLQEILKTHVQNQLQTLKQHIRAYRIEVSDPIASGIVPYSIHTAEKNPTWSPWNDCNLALAFIQKTGSTLRLRLSSHVENIEFDAYLLWLTKFIKQSRLHWGDEFVSSWDFIINDAVDNKLSFEETNRNCCLLLETIRNILPNSKIGFSFTFDEDNEALNSDFFSSDLARRIDFLGAAVDPNNQYRFKQFSEELPLESTSILADQTNRIIKQLEDHDLRIPIYINSWSTLTGDTLRISGMFFRGALLMQALMTFPAQVTSLGFWLNSELQNEVTDRLDIITGGVSLFFSETTRRPVFHVLSLRERIKGEVIDIGPDWMLTKNDDMYYIVCLNPVNINPILSIKQHLLREYTKKIGVSLQGLKPGVWRIKKWQFDQKNGALYYQYSLHPTRFDRDEETMNYISRRSEPTLTVCDEWIKQLWSTEITMELNAICLFELKLVLPLEN